MSAADIGDAEQCRQTSARTAAGVAPWTSTVLVRLLSPATRVMARLGTPRALLRSFRIAAFAALGLAIASLVPNARSAPAVANATILPLAFISDVFIPLDDPPRWLEVIGNIFPLKPFVNAFQNTLNPLVDPPGFSWSKLAVVAAWGIFGALLATRTFTWEPSTRASRRKRKRRESEPERELVQPSA